MRALILLSVAACGGVRTDATGPLLAEARPSPVPLVVRDAVGGQVYETSVLVRRLAAAGRQVKIEGDCLSACAMLLALERVCYAPSARFGFHAATDPDRSAVDPATEALFTQHLPPGLASWFTASGARARLDGFTYLSAAEVADLDDTPRLCPSI